MIDLFQSRRDCPILCKYWSVKDSNNVLPSAQTDIGMDTQNSIIRKRMYDGTFYAKLEREIGEEKNNVGGVFLIEKTNITISTPDLKKGELKNNDLVVIGEEEYFVEHIDRQVLNQMQLEFGNLNTVSYITYISLRK